MAGILAAFEITALRAIFGDNRAAGVPASWTADLYDGDPDGGGAKVPEAPSVTVANTTANFPVDTEDASTLLLTVNWGTSSGPWSTDGTYVVLSSGGAAYVALQLAQDEAVSVPQAGIGISTTTPIHWADFDLPEVN